MLLFTLQTLMCSLGGTYRHLAIDQRPNMSLYNTYVSAQRKKRRFMHMIKRFCQLQVRKSTGNVAPVDMGRAPPITVRATKHVF
jgi:hypothetical protein